MQLSQEPFRATQNKTLVPLGDITWDHYCNYSYVKTWEFLNAWSE